MLKTPLTEAVGIEVPLICGAMYPCSNAELVAAASEAGAVGIIQPISLTFVHGAKDLREGIRKVRSLTDKPVGFNALVEKSSSKYEERMKEWVDVALEEGIRFFISALGKPDWVVEKVHAVGGIVYHDVTERKWAKLALDHGVDGLICVNSRAGGHAGAQAPERLMDELGDLGVPLVCAGGIGSPTDFVRALRLGYAGVQMGTRFSATTECSAHQDYKDAIVRAVEDDIVLTDKISGVPVAVINTPYIEKTGTKASGLMKRLLRHPKGKHYARMYYTAKSVWQLKQSNARGMNYKDFFQAGKGVQGIHEVIPAGEVVRSYADAARQADTA